MARKALKKKVRKKQLGGPAVRRAGAVPPIPVPPIGAARRAGRAVTPTPLAARIPAPPLAGARRRGIRPAVRPRV